jgi:hypothetical protein
MLHKKQKRQKNLGVNTQASPRIRLFLHHKHLCDTFYLAAICVIDFIEFAISSTSFILPNIITFSSITYLCDYRGKGFELVPPRTTTIMETVYTH